MKKKLLTILLSVFMIMTSFTTNVFALVVGNDIYTNADGSNAHRDPSSGELTFVIKSINETSGTVFLSNASTSIASFIIPETIEYESITYTVTGIKGNTYYDNYSFRDHTSLTSIVLPSTLTTIESNSFIGCTSLTSISIPSNVSSIEGGAFYDCSSLLSVTLESTTPPSLGSSVFSNCNANLKILVPLASYEYYINEDPNVSKGWYEYKDKIGVYVTIADILPEDFPKSLTDAWVNENVKTFLQDDKIVFFKNEHLIIIPLNAILTEKNENYFLNDYVAGPRNSTVTVEFKITGNSLTQIEVDVISTEDNDVYDVEGVYEAPVTIARILPQGFPSTDTDIPPVDAWVNSNGNKAYINKDGYLDFGTLPYIPSKNTVLTKVGNNYQTTSGMCTITFNMESDNLQKISYLYEDTTFEYSPYKFVNEEREATKGSTGEIEFKTYANYQNTPGNVTVKVKLEGEASSTTLTYNTDYTLQTGSTIVKLKGDYVKTLPIGTHTITVDVNGYPSVSQNFKITAESSSGSDPTPRYKVPNTGVEGATNNHSLLKLSSLSLLAIGTYLVIKKKKDN